MFNSASMAKLRRRFHTSAFLLIIFLSNSFHLPALALVERGEGLKEEFTEELLLKPLPDRKVLSHFHFQSSAPPSAANGRHHHLFPKAIAQLARKFEIRELELSFTQGRWNYEKWGGFDPISTTNAKPPGVELWANFDLPLNTIDHTWKNLTHVLSGLFCSSINFLESSTAYSSPTWGFQSNSSKLRYGALPREAVCTENLTPWLKLLPCRDKAGIALLLDRPSIYKSHYHSQRLKLISSEFTGIILEQTLTLVLQPSMRRLSSLSLGDGSLQPSWSLNSLFGKKVVGHCVLAKTSRIFLELENDLALKVDKLQPLSSWNNSAFELSVIPNNEIRELNALNKLRSSVLYVFEVSGLNDSVPLDLGIHWKIPLVWSCSRAPFHVNRFLMGSGNERGSVAITIRSANLHEHFLRASDSCGVDAVIFQVVPWYVKVYYHTLHIFVDGKAQIISDVVRKMKISPSEDKLSSGSMELMLKFPCNMDSATLTLDFDKGFLHIDEYPPDANQGFDIPSALVSFPDFRCGRSYQLDELMHYQSTLLSKFQEGNPVQTYTEVLLVPLTTPDFSMPYNVITFTCTVLALYFGSMLNVLRRRVGEEGRLSRSKASEKPGLIPQLLSKLASKLKGKAPEPPSPLSTSSSILGPKLLSKIILVGLLAVIWNYYLKDS
ncbi:GPI transamidase component PIG-T isoform X2 [Phalaenopsis equestris]|uniref:GPI transamidase component PIG-T isoform X1 n=1 Tax=Phalaenopsis equestris TaxID=78828 RepID=UPI0009E428B4|nr:GPI transamidase component PIG-T isoform X1 [Phalaenopsis equestris]XP_020575015.1 GPI transamidase component PIG-T isoform X2 [Phalaenopsis equestris]